MTDKTLARVYRFSNKTEGKLAYEHVLAGFSCIRVGNLCIIRSAKPYRRVSRAGSMSRMEKDFGSKIVLVEAKAGVQRYLFSYAYYKMLSLLRYDWFLLKVHT